MAQLTDEAEVHKVLTRRLRHEPDLAIWGQLCADGNVQDVIDGFVPAAFEDLVCEYRRFEGYERRKRALAVAPEHTALPDGPREARFAPLEELVALEAAREEGVVSFAARSSAASCFRVTPKSSRRGGFSITYWGAPGQADGFTHRTTRSTAAVRACVQRSLRPRPRCGVTSPVSPSLPSAAVQTTSSTSWSVW